MVAMTPRPPDQETWRRRGFRLAVAALVSAVNVLALLLLVRSLVGGATESGRSLLVAGVELWLTAVLLFAVWFWEFDGDGPIHRAFGDGGRPDFLFPQTDSSEWRPRFGDYLYLSLDKRVDVRPGRDGTRSPPKRSC